MFTYAGAARGGNCPRPLPVVFFRGAPDVGGPGYCDFVCASLALAGKNRARARPLVDDHGGDWAGLGVRCGMFFVGVGSLCGRIGLRVFFQSE